VFAWCNAIFFEIVPKLNISVVFVAAFCMVFIGVSVLYISLFKSKGHLHAILPPIFGSDHKNWTI